MFIGNSNNGPNVRDYVLVINTLFEKNIPPTFDYDNFWQKCYWECKNTDALFSNLTSLVFLHYVAR